MILVFNIKAKIKKFKKIILILKKIGNKIKTK